MDLRERINSDDIQEACHVLNYQPFIITDDIQTGVAYSWCYAADPRVQPEMVFRQSECDAGKWSDVTNINRRLARMYDDIISEVASRFPGGSLFDLGCNNGYFPVAAQLFGMSRSLGMDAGDYSASVALLNRTMGTNAEFICARYDPVVHSGPPVGKFDVVTLSAVLLHNPDPLHLLAWLGSIATKAILFLGQIVESEALTIAYKPPHESLGVLRPFPHYFNDQTRLSRGLLCYSLATMGYGNILEFRWRDEWIPGQRGTFDGAYHPEGGPTKTIVLLATK